MHTPVFLIAQSFVSKQTGTLKLRMSQNNYRSTYDYVFCTLHGTHLNPNHVVEEFKKLLTRAGLPKIRFHDLRHSAATLFLSLGVHPKVVQELLGHTDQSDDGRILSRPSRDATGCHEEIRCCTHTAKKE